MISGNAYAPLAGVLGRKCELLGGLKRVRVRVFEAKLRDLRSGLAHRTFVPVQCTSPGRCPSRCSEATVR